MAGASKACGHRVSEQRQAGASAVVSYQQDLERSASQGRPAGTPPVRSPERRDTSSGAAVRKVAKRQLRRIKRTDQANAA